MDSPITVILLVSSFKVETIFWIKIFSSAASIHSIEIIADLLQLDLCSKEDHPVLVQFNVLVRQGESSLVCHSDLAQFAVINPIVQIEGIMATGLAVLEAETDQTEETMATSQATTNLHVPMGGTMVLGLVAQEAGTTEIVRIGAIMATSLALPEVTDLETINPGVPTGVIMADPEVETTEAIITNPRTGIQIVPSIVHKDQVTTGQIDLETTPKSSHPDHETVQIVHRDLITITTDKINGLEKANEGLKSNEETKTKTKISHQGKDPVPN